MFKKKFFVGTVSAILALSCCVATLAACGSGSSGDKMTSEKVTKEEWEAACVYSQSAATDTFSNYKVDFTIDGKVTTEEGNGTAKYTGYYASTYCNEKVNQFNAYLTSSMKCTGIAVELIGAESSSGEVYYGDPYRGTVYYKETEGEWHSATLMEMMRNGPAFANEVYSMDSNIKGLLLYNFKSAYDRFTWSDGKKGYVYKTKTETEDENGEFIIKFRNKKIVYIEETLSESDDEMSSTVTYKFTLTYGGVQTITAPNSLKEFIENNK